MLDLAIVGGGPGGLMSAWYLKKKLGDLCRVTIYEASDRLGGKIVTRKFDSSPAMYEAGVAEIYDYSMIGPDPLRELIQHFGLQTIPMDAEQVMLDGELLNDVVFFGGVEDGAPLLREVNRRENPLPHFSSTMLPTDIAPLLESTLRITQNISSFDVSNVAPATFLDAAGVQFEYRMLGADDITRQGRAVASIIGGKLYMITYDAPAEYFYPRNLLDVERIVASARL